MDASTNLRPYPETLPTIKTEPLSIVDNDFEFEYVTVKEEVVHQNDVETEDHLEIRRELESMKKESNPGISKLPKPTPTLCLICNTGFPNADQYEAHVIAAHKSEFPFQCRHCKKRFKEKANRNRHETIHDESRFKGPAQFHCDLCDKSYHLKGSLESHKKKVHLGYKPRKRPSSTPNIQHHSKQGTKNPNPFKKPKSSYPCTDCERVFSMRCFLIKHMRSHSDVRPFPCQFCGHAFKSKNALDRHVFSFHELGRKPVSSRPRYKTGEPCVCLECGKSYPVPSQLASHVRLHTGELPFKCDVCEQRFRLADALRRHRLVHFPPDTSGLRSYHCRICGKFKTRFTELINHIQQVHHVRVAEAGEELKPFACGVCGKPYYLGIGAITCALLGHDPTQLQEKMFRYQCPECPDQLGFHSLFALRQHWESTHPSKQVPKRFKLHWFYKKEEVTALPTVTYNKEKVAELRWGVGVPLEVEKSEVELYKKLDLIPALHKHKPRKASVRKERVPIKVDCERCGLTLLRYNYKRHLENCRGGGPQGWKQYTCSTCQMTFRKSTAHQKHEKICSRKGKSGRGQPRKRQGVLVSDKVGVREILNNQTVSVALVRLETSSSSCDI